MVEFIGCRSEYIFNATELKNSIAKWLNEECGSSLFCHADGKTSAGSVLVRDYSCSGRDHSFKVLVWDNSSKNSDQQGTVKLLQKKIDLQDNNFCMKSTAVF